MTNGVRGGTRGSTRREGRKRAPGRRRRKGRGESGGEGQGAVHGHSVGGHLRKDTNEEVCNMQAESAAEEEKV